MPLDFWRTRRTAATRDGQADGSPAQESWLGHLRSKARGERFPAAVALAVLSTTYWDLVDQGEIGNLLSVESGPVPEEPDTFEEDAEDGIYYDDVTGADLKP